MQIPFDTGDIIAALVGFGLVAKGIIDKVYSGKTKDRSTCPMEHSELGHKIDTVITILNERKPK